MFTLILDGFHLHPETVKLAWRLRPEGVMIFTDGMAGMGLEDGEYTLGGQSVTIFEGAAKLTGTETLAGTIAPIDQAMRHFIECTGCCAAEALEMASSRPAQLLGETDRGHLNAGGIGDLILLDSDLQIVQTIIQGEIVYSR